VLAARIDRLAPDQKEVLQAAAVIGKEFSEPVLRAVFARIESSGASDPLRTKEGARGRSAGARPPSGPPLVRGDEDLTAALAALTAAEFIHEQELYPVAIYAFKHPLTQEVAYQS